MEDKETLKKISDIMQKAYSRCSKYNKILVSISGGSDSDDMLDLLLKVCNKEKLTFVFFDTGIEYDATKKHLDYLEKKYDIKIDRQRAYKPVPLGCKEYGVPFLSKYVSEMIDRLQRYNFQWENEEYEVLVEKYCKRANDNTKNLKGYTYVEKLNGWYKGCIAALQWWCNHHTGKFAIYKDKYLKEFIMSNPPTFRISAKCCNGAKKHTSHKYEEDKDFDLKCIGIRKFEGGIRTLIYKSCFDYKSEARMQNFRPIFWLTNEDKKEYEEMYNIQHSDCYTKYGMTRTGCAGCPFSSKFENELAICKQHEPKLYTAICNIFKDSYDYTREYRKYKEKMKKCGNLQISIFDIIKEDKNESNN